MPQNHPQGPSHIRPLYKRKRIWAAGVALFALGAFGGTQSAQNEVDAAHALAAKPVPTVTTTTTTTATATATVTAEPEPAPTVTRTKKVTTPGPTVTVTKTARPATGSGTSGSGGDGGSGTCSITSNAGNCYQAGQFCRNSDHGATTTTAGGTPITCRYSSNAWRWSYS